MANLIKQKFLEGIDSSKFKIEQGGAIKAVNSNGQLVEVFKFDAVNEVVKVFGDEEVAVSSYVDSLMAQEVTDRNAAINDAITALINGAPEALDTLKELADSLANDPNAVNSLITQITQEATTREQADQAIQDQIDGLTSDLSDYIKHDGTVAFSGDVDMGSHKISNLSNGMVPTDAVNKGQLDSGVQESKDYTDDLEGRALLLNGTQMMSAALQMNSNKIEGVANGMVPTDAVNKGQLDSGVQESKDYTDDLEGRSLLLNGTQMMSAALQMNSNKIEGLSNGMVPTDAVNKGQLDAVQSAVDQEASARESADNDLDARLDTLEGSELTEGSVAKAEKDAKDYADSIVLSEASTRQQADSNLQSQIDTEKGRVDAILLAADADKDSFAEIVTLINSIDASNDESLAGHLVATEDAHDASAISFVNTTSGMTATSVQGALDELQSQVDDLDGVSVDLQDQITQEVSDREDAVSAEASRALAAEAALQAAIDAEVTARTADVDAEETRAMDAEQALQISITDLTTYAESVGAFLDQEIADRELAVSAEAQARSDEDATLLKLDGSRTMTGDLVINDGVSQMRKVSLSASLVNESFNANYGTYQTTLEYADSLSQYNSSISMQSGQATIQLSRSLGQDSVDGDGNVLVPAYSYSTFYGSDGITAGGGKFDISCGRFTANFTQHSEILSSGHLVFSDQYVDAFDEDGNFIANYSPSKINFAMGKDIVSSEYEFDYVNNQPVQTGATIIAKGGAIFYRRRSDGLDNTVEISDGNIIAKMVSLMDVNDSSIFVPTMPQHATTKEYVDNSIVASTPVFDRARIEINTSSKLEKVVLGSDAPDELTILVFVNRLALHLNQDYSISNENGDYVLTWMGDFATGGVEAVELGDVVYVTYVKQS